MCLTFPVLDRGSLRCVTWELPEQNVYDIS